ncbi:MAG: type I-F CRISPR-associated protein Csy1, partial [Rhodopirellula sp. JB053]
HPSTFSHPDAKTAPISFQGRASPDGYVRSGNVTTAMDAFGNAAALDVLAFVTILLADGKSVLDHLERRSPAAMELLEVDQNEFESLRSGFLSIKENSKDYPTTVQEVKQVYYPVDAAAQEYHLLSLLTPSGWIKSNRVAIGQREWGEDAKAARKAKKDNKPSDLQYQIFFDRVNITYGGANPQNVSTINAESRGAATLLPTLPPNFRDDHVRKPRGDYFRLLYVRPQSYEASLFDRLDRIFRSDHNDVDVRRRRRALIEELWAWTSELAFELQESSGGWSAAESSSLPIRQRVWLDADCFPLRGDHPSWKKEVAADFANWFLRSYVKRQSQGKEAPPLDRIDLGQFRNEIAELPFDQAEWERSGEAELDLSSAQEVTL